jgi:phenylacetic acid degradation operon negative regulatory protein
LKLTELPPPSARAIILDLLSTAENRVYSAAELTLAGTAFGIEATGMRTAIARLKADGRLRQVERGAYVLGLEGEPLQRRLRQWRNVTERRRSWDGAWLLAFASPKERADRAIWRRTVHALEFDGFAEAEPNLWVRPDNLQGGAATARIRLAELGHAQSMLIVSAREVDAEREKRFRALWNSPKAAREHLALAAALDRYGKTAASLADAPAAALTLLVGREAIRRIVHDALLPDEMSSIDALQTLISAMDRFDVVGRAAWGRFLHGAMADAT